MNSDFSDFKLFGFDTQLLTCSKASNPQIHRLDDSTDLEVSTLASSTLDTTHRSKQQ